MNSSVNSKLDLVLERTVDLKPEEIWQAWTDPTILKQWFTPKPWKTVDAQIDLKPGGLFATIMESPEGQRFPNIGCFLEVAVNRTLVWTSTMSSGYRPQPKPENGAGLDLTAAIFLEPRGQGTLYRAIAMHADEKSRKAHEDMGFEKGWGMALDQLIELMKARR
jgi:uncharacterized protein YndB with AHSA1/START domain